MKANVVLATKAILIGYVGLNCTLANASFPFPFLAAQEQAASAVLVVARGVHGNHLLLEVKKTIIGNDAGGQMVLQHPELFQGSQVRDGHIYLILLGQDGEPFHDYLVAGGLPLLGCGVINVIEVVDGLLLEPALYDPKYGSGRLSLSAVEKDLVRSRKWKKGG